MRLVLPVPGVTKQNGWPKAKQQGVPYEPFSKRTRIWNLVSMQHTVAACKRDKSQHACSRPVFTPCLCCLPIYLAFLLRLLVQALFTLLNSPPIPHYACGRQCAGTCAMLCTPSKCSDCQLISLPTKLCAGHECTHPDRLHLSFDMPGFCMACRRAV